jgi:hypothetical protein
LSLGFGRFALAAAGHKDGVVVVGSVGVFGITGMTGPGLVITGIPSVVAHGSQGLIGWQAHGSHTCTGGQIGAGVQGWVIIGAIGVAGADSG